MLLLDEPFAGLDAPTRADLLDDATAALVDARRATVVVVHDRAEAWALADRVLILLDGRPAAHGPVRDVLEAPPTPEVAAFVGFSGTLHEPDGTLRMLKPAHADARPVRRPRRHRHATDPGRGRGPARADAAERAGASRSHRCPGPRPGDTVRVRLAAGISYPRTAP